MTWTIFFTPHLRRGALLVAVALLIPSVAAAAADRYGGVWHPGKATGVFVPAAAKMTWADVLSYRNSWGASYSYRIKDIEVVAKGCPSDRRDLFATQWEEGSWNDKLYVVSSLAAVQTALDHENQTGYRLEDFEIWESECDEPVRYILLFRQVRKPNRYTPLLGAAKWRQFPSFVETYNGYGYTLVDFEIDTSASQQDPTIRGVWYWGPSTQKLELLYRPAFEAKMEAAEGAMTLMDMESFRRVEGFQTMYWRRYVAALWEVLPTTNADDHEVGEVYSKFKQLAYMQPAKRKLVDFEVHPNTSDDRFRHTFEKHLDGIAGGYAFAVLQAGELVAGEADGWARAPGEGSVTMGLQVPGAVASVTKFFTALGVLRFADKQPNPATWLDEPLVQHLPGDFGPFGAGVETVTLRELLRQRTGLATFMPTVNPVQDPSGFRQQIIDWLGQPLANPMKAFQYQNVHFELLAIVMNEVELPPVMGYANSWRDWINQEVFASAGVGPRFCGGTANDALSYPLATAQGGIEWFDSSWDCAGWGTGVGMFWASALDLAKVNAAFRAGQIVSPALVSMALAQSFGLESPDDDGLQTTIGDVLVSKNGGLCGYTGGDSGGTETLIARFDDYNFDDDASPPAPATNDYPYEVGHRDFDIGIMIHSSPYAGQCSTARSFPVPKAILQEALRKPEAW